MNPSLAAVALVTALAASAMLGPLLLRRSAPALMRVPRIAVAVVSGGAVAWSAALLALGPMVAWAATGPSLLAGGAGDVCQRCLASASPFAAQGGSLAVPAIVPLTIGALTALVVAGGVAVELRRRRGASRATALWLQENATRTVAGGQQVRVVEDASPYAWALPSRHGGIVVSTGALAILTDEELAAVIAHERAHLRQGHHLASALVAGLQRTLGWVPAVRSASKALPHYLEIAADAHAQRVAGTPALASALLVLASPTTVAGQPAHRTATPVLHAVGPHRIGRLVGVASARGGTMSASVAAGVSLAHVLLGIAVMVPYAIAVATGCA